MNLLSIDPGVHDIWIAHWRARELVKAERLKAVNPRQVSSHVYHAAQDLAAVGRPPSLAIEVPQIYQAGMPKTNQQDLIDLTLRAGWCQGAYLWDDMRQYFPRQWKGQLPKRTCRTRSEKALSQRELDVVAAVGVPSSLQHNLWDAVGIGLKHLKRR